MIRLRKLKEKKFPVYFVILALRNPMQEDDRLEDLSYTVSKDGDGVGWGDQSPGSQGRTPNRLPYLDEFIKTRP